MAPIEVKPSNPWAHSPWKISTSSPYAAPAESRFSAIELAAITTDRKVNTMTRKVSTSTKPMTSGNFCRT